MPPLPDGGVQVWRLDLGAAAGPGMLAGAFEALTFAERQRAAKMRRGTAPEEFIAGRGYLRRLLGAELNCDPRAVRLAAGPHRKPEVEADAAMRAPLFNVSHSHGMVLIALSRAGPVGVDVEYMESTIAALEVARGAFHPLDLAQIEGAASPHTRKEAFYRCWTRREAVAKADGRGLTLPASRFAAGTDFSQQQFVDLGEEGDGAAKPGRAGPGYFVSSLEVGMRYQGAVAVSRAGAVPQLFDLSRLFCQAAAGPSLLSGESYRAPESAAAVTEVRRFSRSDGGGRVAQI